MQPDDPHLPAPPPELIVAARPITPPVTALSAPEAPPPPVQPLDLPSLSVRDACLDLALVLAALVVLPLVTPLLSVAAFGAEAAGQAGPVDGTVQLFLTLEKAAATIFTLGVTAYLLLRHRLPAASFGLQLERPGEKLLWAVPTTVALFAAVWATVSVIVVVEQFLPGLDEDLAERERFFELIPMHNELLLVLLLIPVAIDEEVIFRGLLIPYLHRVGCTWPAAVGISALIFGALHIAQGGIGIFQATVLGVVFGAAFYKTRSVLPTIVAHFIFNLVQVEIMQRLLS